MPSLWACRYSDVVKKLSFAGPECHGHCILYWDIGARLGIIYAVFLFKVTKREQEENPTMLLYQIQMPERPLDESASASHLRLNITIPRLHLCSLIFVPLSHMLGLEQLREVFQILVALDQLHRLTTSFKLYLLLPFQASQESIQDTLYQCIVFHNELLRLLLFGDLTKTPGQLFAPSSTGG
ncbi:uncharacterized protein BJX67DRAFT_81661 [Aspergillus lucknowensis]|uniref:Uncharacterized protein n=1 Tax=Aspergillus lucknowensis TaxID=176173 RepID=A0ABR4LRY6_9EURO